MPDWSLYTRPAWSLYTTPWVHPSGMAWLHAGVHGYMARLKCAMGSKRGVRTAGTALEVNLGETICLLAPFLRPCCKNQPVSKAPGCLDLSNPCRILLRVVLLP